MRYIDNGKDQSADMNKLLSARINIIDSKNTVDIEGEVDAAIVSAGDRVQINSEPKTSRLLYDKIKKVYTYKLVGVKPDKHEIGIYSAGSSTPKGSSELSIVKGDTASVVGNVITIDDIVRTVNIKIDNSYRLIIDDELESIVPEGKALLADVVTVGEYVNYTYTPADYTLSNVGWTDAQLFSSKTGGNVEIGSITTHTVNKTPTWRVLSVENGIVTLISSEAIDANVYLSGKEGYMNAPTALNTMCQTLYSGEHGTARSLTRKDVFSAIVKDGAVINEKDIYIGSDGKKYTIIDELNKAGYTDEVSSLGDEITVNELVNIYEKLPATSAISNVQTPNDSPIGDYVISYYDSISSANYVGIEDLRNNPTYSLIFTGTKSSSSSPDSKNVSYWLADTGLAANYNESAEGKTFYDFNVGFVSSGTVSATSLFESDGTLKGLPSKPKKYGIRPVVVLKKNLMVDVTVTPSKNLDTAYGDRYYEIWNID